MELNIKRESVEAVIALVVAAGSAGVILGYNAATSPGFAAGYSLLGIWLGLSGIVIGRAVERLVEAGKIPGTEIAVDAPNNATTGFYAMALCVMIVGLAVEVAFRSLNPVSLVLFVACGALCFERAFRRGTEHSDTTA